MRGGRTHGACDEGARAQVARRSQKRGESAIPGQFHRGLRAREAAFARGRPGGSARPGETPAAGAPRPRARRKPRRFWPETRTCPPDGRARARAGTRTGGRLGAGRGAPGHGGRKRGTPARQPRTPSGESAPGRPPTKRAQHETRRRPRRKNAGHPSANCPQGSGKGVHPRPPEAKRTRPGRSRNPSDRAAPGESGCPPSRRCGECATWPC